MRHPAPSFHAMVRATEDDGLDFAPFVVSAATLRRPAMDRFAPRFETSEDVIEAMRRVERLDHDLARDPHASVGLVQRLRRETLTRNAFATASIEGNPLSLSQVDSLLKHPSPAAANDPDEVEILNYAQLMTGPDAARAPRTTDDVRGLHARLFRGVLKDAGRWKRAPNFIGNRATRAVVYVPTSPKRVERELGNALDWLHEARSVHPLVRAVLFHHEFEAIHPFRDGNGRAGRAAMAMALRSFGYAASDLAPIDFHLHRHRESYYRTLALVERNGFTDHTPWLAFMMGVVRDAYEDASAQARFQGGLPDALTPRQRQVAEWFARLHEADAERRVKFNDVHHAFLEVADRTLKRDLAALRDAGVLEVEGVLKGTTYRLAGGGASRTRTSRPSRGRATRTRCGRRAPR